MLPANQWAAWQETCEGYMEALRKALRNEPHLIYKSVEGLMSEEFGLRSAVPNMTAPRMMTVRAWAEHRSKIDCGFPHTARWVWGVRHTGQPHDSNPKTHARACLMLCQAEQDSLDRGSDILSQEMPLGPPPP